MRPVEALLSNTILIYYHNVAALRLYHYSNHIWSSKGRTCAYINQQAGAEEHLHDAAVSGKRAQ